MTTSKQRAILEVLQLNGPTNKLRLTKLLFLIKQTFTTNEWSLMYDFVPYQYGPYSFELSNNLWSMERNGMIKVDGNQVSLSDGSAPTKKLEPSRASGVIDEYKEISDRDLLRTIYNKYPEYSIFSKIARKMVYTRDRTGIMTIGYEGLTIDAFMKRLIDEKVQDLVDIRNNPWSMKYGYTRGTLENICNKLEIEYHNIQSLGIPSSKRKQVRTQTDLDVLFKEFRGLLTEQTVELKKLIDLGKKRRIALMCFERDPLLCHRSIVAEALTCLGAEVELR
jgi:uncharacterized protein (DUF488 family)